MKLFFIILIFAISITGCATKYSYHTQKLENSEWKGPFNGDEELEMRLSSECLSPGFYGSYSVRIHFEDSGEERTYICSEYPKYQ